MTNSCRRPPLPFYNAPKGTCRWCGEGVVAPARNWHPECAAAYSLAVNSGSQRSAVWARDKGVCKGCGGKHQQWQADHIVPLHSITPSQLEDYPAVLRFWSIENLQTLCTNPCHNAKSALEATVRAKVKRIRARIDGTRRERKKVPQRAPWSPNTKYLNADLQQTQDVVQQDTAN